MWVGVSHLYRQGYCLATILKVCKVKAKELNKEYILIETVYKINYLTVTIIIVNLIGKVKNNNNLW